MSVVFKFVRVPSIKGASTEILKEFMGLEVPINYLEAIGSLGSEKSSLGKYPNYEFNSQYVVMTKEALVLAAFSQRRYELGHFLNKAKVVAERFKVERDLVTEVY